METDREYHGLCALDGTDHTYTLAKSNPNAVTDAYTGSNANTYANAHTYADANTYADGDADDYTDADGDANDYTDTDANTRTDACSNSNAYADTCSGANPNADRCPDGDADGNASSGANRNREEPSRLLDRDALAVRAPNGDNTDADRSADGRPNRAADGNPDRATDGKTNGAANRTADRGAVFRTAACDRGRSGGQAACRRNGAAR